MIEKIKQQWFLIGLVFVFMSVMADRTGTLPDIGFFFKTHYGPDLVIFIIFLFSGIIIKTEQIRAGIRDVKVTATALFVIFIVSPLSAAALSVLPVETGVVIGMFIVSVMPTTLSSGVVMTGRAGGNMAHALFITILANFISIVSIPFVLSILLSFFGEKTIVNIDQYAIMKKLFFLVLIPMASGMAIKACYGKIHDKQLKILQAANQVFVICIVFMAASGSRNVFIQKTGSLFSVILMVVVFHLLLLLFSFILSYLFKIKKGRRESQIFMGSQKTLPLSVILQVTLFPEYGSALLVCVVHHIVHLIIDGYLAVKLGEQSKYQSPCN
ncbi:MAG: bile acid:sodium symporter [Thermodesulfobacteriota bacterium]|nr:bile acid:sodium symporter [Thermodesulfobacteriota bacterium]